MKEKLCVLAKTYPNVSKKYYHLVCVGGFTQNFKWRRIYPVPWKMFWENQTSFKKKSWIEYETQSDVPSDHRSESRKVIDTSIKSLGDAKFKEINDFLRENITTMEKLTAINHRKVSMGVIKPYKILNFVQEPNEHYEKNIQKQAQQTLDGGSAVKIDILPKTYSYVFYCSPDCKTKHKIMCEDWELGQLYRNCEKFREQGKYKDEKEVFEKIREKFLDTLPKKKDFYFIVGTHYRFTTYMIISVIYPKKNDVY